MREAPGRGVAVGPGIGSSAATGAGVAWWVVAAAVLRVAGPAAARGRRATADE